MSITPLSEVYADPQTQARIDEYGYYSGHELAERDLPLVGEFADQADPFEFLNSLDPELAHHYKNVLQQIPPELIYAHYGAEVLVWTVVHTSSLETNWEFRKAAQELAGIDASWLEKARLWEWRHNHMSNDAAMVLAQYRLIEATQTGGLDVVNLPAILASNAKSGEIKPARIAEYSLIPLAVEKREIGDLDSETGAADGWYDQVYPGEHYSIWLDAPSGFALTYKDRPICVAAVTMNSPTELMIRQLQGVRAHRVDPTKSSWSKEYIIGSKPARGIGRLDWQAVLRDVSIELAKSMDATHLGVQAGERNRWRKPLRSNEKAHLSHEAAVRAYDHPATRWAFYRGTDGNWHKRVSDIASSA